MGYSVSGEGLGGPCSWCAVAADETQPRARARWDNGDTRAANATRNRTTGPPQITDNLDLLLFAHWFSITSAVAKCNIPTAKRGTRIK